MAAVGDCRDFEGGEDRIVTVMVIHVELKSRSLFGRDTFSVGFGEYGVRSGEFFWSELVG